MLRQANLRQASLRQASLRQRRLRPPTSMSSMPAIPPSPHCATIWRWARPASTPSRCRAGATYWARWSTACAATASCCAGRGRKAVKAVACCRIYWRRPCMSRCCRRC
ncbi:MAG: hypothetical protein ACN6PB_04810 [Achromobacter kerstersii]